MATMCDPYQCRHITKTSVNWCMEYDEELCHECIEYHTALKAMRNHHVVGLKLNKSCPSLLKKHRFVSEQHTDCEVEYFSVDHDELCSRDCLAKTNKSCVNTMSLDSVSNGAKQYQLFSDCQEQLPSISQTYKSILKYRSLPIS